MFELKKMNVPFAEMALKAKDDGGYSFEGYASVFNGVDSYGDTILPGAYKDAIKEAKKTRRHPKMFFNHRSYDLPIGKWDHMEEDKTGLLVAGTLTKGMLLAEDVRLSLAAETVDGMSVGIGLKSTDYKWTEEETDKELRNQGIFRVIENVTLLKEISIVTFPADDKGRVDVDSIKAELNEVVTLADLEQFLRDAGSFSKSAATAVVSRAKAILHGEHGVVDEAKSVEQEVQALLSGAGLLQHRSL